MVKHALYMAMGKGCHAYLQGHINDDRPWHVISDENDVLQVGVSWSGCQRIRYESGWREEHKIENYSRLISHASTVKREWQSQIEVSGDHLRFWDEVMISNGEDSDYLSTFAVETDSDDPMLASGGMYCTGVDTHSDPGNKPRSALLIVHNEGFIVKQEGLGQNQPVGKILILHTHEPHSLFKVTPSAQRWAAVFLDYEKDLSFKAIEESLKENYLRVFNE